MEEIMESYEVASQRVKDLVRYLKGNLPELYGTATQAVLSRSDLLMVLGELDEEFSHSTKHRISISAIMTQKITTVIEPLIEATVASRMNSTDYTGDDFEDGVAHGKVEVVWDSIFPSLLGDLGQLSVIAGVAASAQLNASLWDDPDWDTSAETQMASLQEVFELYHGMVGFLILNSYIQIVEMHNVPRIEWHLST